MDIDLSTIAYKNMYWAILIPLVLMAADFVTGFLNAWKRRKIKSSVMREGLAKKLGECVVLFIALFITRGTNLTNLFLYGCSFYIGLMEIVSINENCDKLGIPIPKPIKKAIGTFKDAIQNGGESDEPKHGGRNKKS